MSQRAKLQWGLIVRLALAQQRRSFLGFREEAKLEKYNISDLVKLLALWLSPCAMSGPNHHCSPQHHRTTGESQTIALSVALTLRPEPIPTLLPTYPPCPRPPSLPYPPILLPSYPLTLLPSYSLTLLPFYPPTPSPAISLPLLTSYFSSLCKYVLQSPR